MIGAIAAGLTGGFWLLNATDGDPAPYLAAAVPVIAISAIFVELSITFTIATALDERQIRETGRVRLGWEGVTLLLATLAVLLLPLAVIIFLSP